MGDACGCRLVCASNSRSVIAVIKPRRSAQAAMDRVFSTGRLLFKLSVSDSSRQSSDSADAAKKANDARQSCPRSSGMLSAIAGIRMYRNNLRDFHINVVENYRDGLSMRALFGVACVASFFLWDLVFDQALYTKLIAAVGQYWLMKLWHLIL